MPATDKYGTLEPAGDRWRLVFRRYLPHPPDKVWRAISEPEHRDSWFPQKIVGEWHTGATLKFVSEYGDFEGQVLAFEPPRLVEFAWGTDTIRLEVQADGDGTLLTLSDTFAEHGKAARDAAGWHVCLAALESSLEARAPGESQWQALFAQYAERFGPEAATEGPPPIPAEKA
jgi:uncharacterized protein YndB with AHSA1/START domain